MRPRLGRLDLGGGGECHLDISAVAFSKGRSTAPFSIDPSVYDFYSNSHLCFVSFPAKAKGPTDESNKEGQVRGRDILFPLLSFKRLRSCSFGQRLAAPIKLASRTLPLENSPPLSHEIDEHP
jgi:hypothetical protein